MNRFLATCPLLFSMVWAGPITTVPWNGFDGAVSLTFDDGSPDQLQNFGGYLNEHDDVKVTFFITGAMHAGVGDMSGYVEMTKKGHEVGNHSKSHNDLRNAGDLQGEITGYKATLESKGVEVVSFATPFCGSNANVESEMDKSHIVNRNCAGARNYGWNTEPNWMDISSDCYSGNTQQSISNMKSAGSAKSWTVQLNHAIGQTDNNGILTNDLISIIDEARNQNLWIAPIGRVAAYYRAHFVIDKATSTNVDGGFKVAWTSPHPAMPKSVPLRVKIEGVDGKTVKQKGKAIEPESDGSYIIEFMDLELEVVDAVEPQGITWNVNLYKNSAASYGVFSATGVLVKTFDATFENVAEQFNALRIPRGVYYVKCLQQGQMRKMVK